MTWQFVGMKLLSNYFDVVVFLLFSYWFKFHFYKRLTRNLEITNTPVWVLPNTWRLGQVRDTKFGTNVSNKSLLNAAKCQVYSFYCFWVTKGKPTGIKLSPTQIIVNIFTNYFVIQGYKTFWIVIFDRLHVHFPNVRCVLHSTSLKF